LDTLFYAEEGFKMRKRSILFLLFFILFSNVTLFAQAKKNILIINSYHRGFQWSDDIIKGIEETLYDTTINSTVLYMDSKRISSEQYYKELKDLYELQLKKNQFDLIVAVDNFAYEFALKNYKDLFNDEPLFFIGLEQYSQEKVDQYQLTGKVSGLMEKRAIDDVVKVMHTLIPTLKKMYIINDKSKNGDDTDPFIQSAMYDLKSKTKVEYIRQSSLEELKSKFSTFKKNEAILFIRFYNDKNGTFHNNDEIAEMINHSRIPVFSTDTLFLSRGSVGGRLVNIEQLGINAGKKILHILNQTIETPFIKIDDAHEYMFDYHKLQGFRLNANRIAQPFTYVNSPLSFFDKNRQFIEFVFLLSPFLLFLILGLIHNLYLRIKSTKLLKQRMQFDKVLLNSIKSPIVWQDDTGKVVDSNIKFCDFMRLPCPEIKGKTLEEYVQKNNPTRISDALQPFMHHSLEHNQITLKDHHNNEHIYLINQTNYTEDIFKTKGTVTVFTDITKEQQAIKEKTKHQEFIIQQSKLAEIGEIFSSIAHQWKTPLVEIATIAQEQLYNEEGEIDEANSEYVNDIMVQVKYMTQTINNFQKFIMPSTQKVVFDISESVHEMLEIIRHNMKYNYIDVNVTVNPNTNLMILGYKNELMQTLLNIVNNAKDAIIKAKSNGDIEQGHIDILIRNINNLVQIEIMDNGGGIPTQYLNQIFEAYFTTKNHGHGIGLYMAKLIIEDKIGGTITASNEKNGAKFTIQLELKNENSGT
jgi:signal transduction histidine kinase/ABC-type uncharacterized transport system substrate-binding protein